MTKKVAEASKYKGLSYFHKKGGLEPKGDQLNGMSVHEETYNYDKRGNLTHIFKDGQLVNQYYFGALNRLESAMNYESEFGATYQYNGLGNRIGKMEGTLLDIDLSIDGIQYPRLKNISQINDVIDLTKQYHNLLQRNEDDNLSMFIWDGNVLSSIGVNKSTYYCQDDLGSPIRVVDQFDKKQETYGYDEFGQDLYKNNGDFQPFGYIGYQKDNIANTYFAQARDYCPIEGRFISEDVVKGNGVFPITLNPYIYCWARPLSLRDLDGKLPDDGLTREERLYIGNNPEASEIHYNSDYFSVNVDTDVLVEKYPDGAELKSVEKDNINGTKVKGGGTKQDEHSVIEVGGGYSLSETTANIDIGNKDKASVYITGTGSLGNVTLAGSAGLDENMRMGLYGTGGANLAEGNVGVGFQYKGYGIEYGGKGSLIGLEGEAGIIVDATGIKFALNFTPGLAGGGIYFKIGKVRDIDEAEC